MTGLPNVTILGYGKIARDAHGPAWRRVVASGNAVVGTIVEPTESGCAAAAEAFPEAEVRHADARSVFDGPLSGDVVDVCTPGHLHHDLVMCALAAGCHVLVEKPLAHSAAEVREIVAAQDGAVVQVCQTFRLTSPVRDFLQAMEMGRVGRITRVHMTHHARHILSEAEWVTRSKSDGVIFENAIHFLDLLPVLLGAEAPLTIDASRFRQTEHRPVLTGFEMFARDSHGRHATVDFLQDSLAHSALMSRIYISATGADAELRFYPEAFRLLSGVVDPLHDLRDDIIRVASLARRAVVGKGGRGTHDILITNFLRARAGQAEPLCAATSALPGVALAEALSEAWAATVSPDRC